MVEHDEQMRDPSPAPGGEQRTDAGPISSATPADAPRMLRSEEIFAGRRTVVIQHAGTQYRLLITRNDRLILQK